MKDVAYIKIPTHSSVIKLVVPNTNIEQAQKLVDDARAAAKKYNEERKDEIFFTPVFFIFTFKDERLEINNPATSVHVYIKNENYPYDTPTIDVNRA